MNGSIRRRSITGLQAIALIADALVLVAVLGSVLGWWTLWVDLG